MVLPQDNRKKALSAINSANVNTTKEKQVGTMPAISEALRTFTPKPSAFQEYVLESNKYRPVPFTVSSDTWKPSFQMDNMWKTTIDPEYNWYAKAVKTAQDKAWDELPVWKKVLPKALKMSGLQGLGIPISVVAGGVSDTVDLLQAGVAVARGQDPHWDENNPFSEERWKQWGKVLQGEEYWGFGNWLAKENWRQNTWSTKIPMNPLHYLGVGPELGLTVSESGLIALPMELIFDPLNWFGMLGAGRAIGTSIVRSSERATRTAVKELLEEAFVQNVYRQTGKAADDITAASIRSLVPDEVIDDLANQINAGIANLGSDATTAQTRQTVTSILDGFAITQNVKSMISGSAIKTGGIIPVSVTPTMGPSGSRLFFKGAEESIEEVVTLGYMFRNTTKMGRSSLSIEDLQYVARWAEKRGLDDNLRTVQQFLEAGGAKLDDAGNVIQGQWNKKAADHVVLKAADVDKLSYGVKIPFTGDIARNTNIPFSKRFGSKEGVSFASGAQKIVPAKTLNRLAYRARLTPTLGIADRQYGITLFKFASPTADKAFRALPRVFRGTWGKYATKQGVKALARLDGGLPTAKTIIRGSDNPWEVIAAKEILSYNGQARALAQKSRIGYDRHVHGYIGQVRNVAKNETGNIKPILRAWQLQNNIILGDGVNAYAKNMEDAFQRLLISALEDDQAAVAIFKEITEVTGIDLVDAGKNMFERLRLTANTQAGTPFLRRRTHYFPHQLTDEWKQAHDLAKKGKAVGPEARRGYVEPKEVEEAFEKWFLKNVKPIKDPQGKIVPFTDAKMKSFRKQFDALGDSPSAEFMGYELGNMSAINPLTGEAYGTIPEQIDKILKDLGMNDAFFSFDLEKVLLNYSQGLSNLTGMNWLDQRLIKSGWSPNATGWITGIKMPSRASVLASRKLTRMIQVISKVSNEIDEKIVESASASLAEARVIEETIVALENQFDALLTEYDTELVRALEREVIVQRREITYIDAMAKQDELFETLMKVMDTQENFLGNVEKFKTGEIESLLEFPEFQAALDADANIIKLNDELEELLIGGELTENAYYHMYESLSNGVQERARIEEALIEKFGSIEAGREIASAYTKAIAEIIQANRKFEAFRKRNLPVNRTADPELESEIINSIWDDTTGQEIWKSTVEDIKRIIQGIEAGVDPSEISDPLLRLARQSLGDDYEKWLSEKAWGVGVLDDSEITVSILWDEMMEGKIQINQRREELLDAATNSMENREKVISDIPELFSLEGWERLTREELIPIVMRQVESELPEAVAKIKTWNKIALNEAAQQPEFARKIEKMAIDLTLRRWEDDLARQTFPDAPPQRAQALDEPAFRDPITGEDVTPAQREMARRQVEEEGLEVFGSQKLTKESLEDIQSVEVENTVKTLRQKWENADAPSPVRREGEDVVSYMKRQADERMSLSAEDEMVTPMGAQFPEEDLLARMGPEETGASVSKFMTPQQAVKVLNDGGVGYNVNVEGAIQQMVPPKKLVLPDGTEISFREVTRFFENTAYNFDEGMGQWFALQYWDPTIVENPANFPATMYKTLELMDMQISSNMDELEAVAKKYANATDKGPIDYFGVPTVENVEKWRTVIKSHLNNGPVGQGKTFANPAQYQELIDATRQYYLLMGKTNLAKVENVEDLLGMISKYRESIQGRVAEAQAIYDRNPFANLDELMKVQIGGRAITLRDINIATRQAVKTEQVVNGGVVAPKPLKKFDIKLEGLNPEQRIEPEVIGFAGSEAFPVAPKESKLLDGFYKGGDERIYYVRSFDLEDSATPAGKRKNIVERDSQLAANKVYEVLGVVVPRMEARTHNNVAYTVMQIEESIKPHATSGTAPRGEAQRNLDQGWSYYEGQTEGLEKKVNDSWAVSEELTGLPVEPEILNLSKNFISDVLLGNWNVAGKSGSPTKNYGILWGEVDPTTGRPSMIDSWGDQAERFGRFETVRYSMEDAFHTAKGVEKHLDPKREYQVLDYVDGELQFVSRRPTGVSVNEQGNVSITKHVPESFANSSENAQEVYQAKMLEYNKKVNERKQVEEVWEKYDKELSGWEANAGKSTKPTNLLWGATDEEIRTVAKERLAKEITDQQGITTYANDVEDMYPMEFAHMVDNVNKEIFESNSFVNEVVSRPSEPSMPRPTGKKPVKPEKPKGVKDVPPPRDRVRYSELDGTVVERQQRRPSVREKTERKDPFIEEWLETKGFSKSDRVYGTGYQQWRSAGFAARRAQRKIKELTELQVKDLDAQIVRIKDDLSQELDGIFSGVDDLAGGTEVMTPVKSNGQPRETVGVNYDITEMVELGLGPELYGTKNPMWFDRPDKGMLEDRLPSGFLPASLDEQVTRVLATRNAVGGWEAFLKNSLPNADAKTVAELAHFLEVRTRYLAEWMGHPYLVDPDEMLKQFAGTILPEKVIFETFSLEGRAGLLRLLDNAPSTGDDAMDLRVINGVPQMSRTSQQMSLAPYAYREGVDFTGLSLDTEMGNIKFYGIDPLFNDVPQTGEGSIVEALLNLDGAAQNAGALDLQRVGNYQKALDDFFTELSVSNPAGRKGDKDLTEFTEGILRLVGWDGPTRVMPADMISMGERLVDVLGRQNPETLDTVIRLVTEGAATVDETKALNKLLVNDHKGDFSLTDRELGMPIKPTEEIVIPPAGITDKTGEGKIFLNNIYGEDTAPRIVDTLSKAQRNDAYKSVQTLARVRSVRSFINKDPVLSNFFSEGGTFQEVIEFLSWRDTKYRQIDAVNDYLVKDVERLKTFMDDLSEYAYATDSTNPFYEENILKAKMQSYVHVNRVMGLLSKRGGKNVEALIDDMLEAWKVSLANDGFIGVAQPRTIGHATYDKRFRSVVNHAKYKLATNQFDPRVNPNMQRSATDSARKGIAMFGDPEDLRAPAGEPDPSVVRRIGRVHSDMVAEDYNSQLSESVIGLQGEVSAPFVLDFTVTNPRAVVVDPEWALHRAQMQVDSAIESHSYLSKSGDGVWTAKAIEEAKQEGRQFKEIDPQFWFREKRVFTDVEMISDRQHAVKTASGETYKVGQKIYAPIESPLHDPMWQRWWKADKQELVEEIYAAKMPTRESLIKRYDEQARDYLNVPPQIVADDAAMKSYKAIGGGMFPANMLMKRPPPLKTDPKLAKALDVKDAAAAEAGYSNFSMLKKDVFEQMNQTKQTQNNMTNLQGSLLERVKALGDLHRIRTSRPIDAQTSKDIEKLRRFMPDDEIEATGLAKELGEVELRILAEKQALEHINQRLALHVDARNKLKNMVEGLNDDDLLALGTMDNLLDFSSSLKQLGITDLDSIDEILGVLNNPKPLVDDIFTPSYGQMSDKTKEQLFSTLVYQHDAAKNPIGFQQTSREGVVETIMGTTHLGLESGGKSSRKIVQYYDNVHNVTKGYMILKAGFLARNFYGAVWMNYLANVPASSYGRFLNAFRYVKYQDEIANAAIFGAAKPKMRRRVLRDSQQLSEAARKKTTAKDINMVRAMVDQGLVGKESGSGFNAAEFIPAEKKSITIRGKEYKTTIRAFGRDWNTKRAMPFSSQFMALTKFRGANATVEDVVRGSLGLHVLDSGGTVDNAWDEIVKWHFDYSDLGNTERQIKRLIPFYTWSRHAVPLTVGQYFKQPAKFFRYAQVMRALTDKEDRNIGPVPDWMIRQGGVRLPESMDYKGNPIYFMPDLPMRSVQDLLKDPAEKLTRGDVLGAAGEVLRSGASMMTPMVKAPLETMMNRNIWKDYSFADRYEHVPFWLEKVPLLMPMMENQGIARQLPNGGYAIKSKWLHFLTSVTPPISDLRRIVPTEEKYQERHFSNIMSWFFGLGMRTLSPYEIEQAQISNYYENQQRTSDANRLQLLDALRNND